MMSHKKITVAAIQLNTDIGNTSKNLAACKRLAEEAWHKGARWIGLPEFFNTGVAWMPELVKCIEDENGISANFLKDFSKQKSVVIGGSFLCRIATGGVRNRYLCFSNGELVGKHDKDLPTMWENAFYEEGDANDTGFIGTVGGIRVGSAVCWEYLRTQTARRLNQKIDVMIGGSHWWSMPTNWPTWMTANAEKYNTENLMLCVQETARLIGAPVIHGSHCNRFSCPLPGTPFIKYRGILEGNASIVDAKGNILVRRRKEQGAGIVLAEITLGNIHPSVDEIPTSYWLRKRTFFGVISWNIHGYLGRHWYRKNVLIKK